MRERSGRKGVHEEDEKYCTVEEKGANDEHVRYTVEGKGVSDEDEK